MPLLSSVPPGYDVGSKNKQTIGGLAVPGGQANAITPGNSSFAVPSNIGNPIQAPTMTPYSKSPNMSTLLRVLLGNIKT